MLCAMVYNFCLIIYILSFNISSLRVSLIDYVYFIYLSFTNVVCYAPLSGGIFRMYGIYK